MPVRQFVLVPCLLAACLVVAAAAAAETQPCAPRSLGFDAKEAGWKHQPLSKLKRNKSREDAALRVMVAFGGDVSKPPEDEQARFKRAKQLSGRVPP